MIWTSSQERKIEIANVCCGTNTKEKNQIQTITIIETTASLTASSQWSEEQIVQKTCK